MKIAILGATGFVGSKILQEAVSRGHDVLAIMRNAEKVPPYTSVTTRELDIRNTDALAEAIRGCDVVVHAFSPPHDGTMEERIARQSEGTRSIIKAVKQAGIERLLAVGGAGTSEVAPGVPLLDSYFFPPEYESGARATAVIKDILQNESDLDWAFVSPPNFLEPGTRTGKYRTGADNMIVDMRSGRSYISVADYAVAMLDEIEKPRHHRQRFTVGT